MNALFPLAQARSPASVAAAPWQERGPLAYILLLLLAAALVIPANLNGPLLHDSLAIYWVWADQFTAELARGNLYPRWLPMSDAGLGSPVFYFYPPLAFHLTGAFGVAGLSTYASLMAAFASAFAASGIACWHWLKGRSNHPLLGAAFFMAAPYHLFNFTVRGALAESVATALIPFIAIGLRRITERRGGVVFTALAYAAIILTHLPLALLVSLFLIAPYVLVHRERLTDFAIAITAGIGLAAIYLVPAFALDGYRDVALLYRTPNLRTDYWSIFSGNWSDVTFTVVFVIVAALLAAAALPAVVRRDRWAMHAIAVAVLVGGAIPFVWSLPLLHQVQFPFRALPIAEFGLATTLARLPRARAPALALVALPLAVSLMVLPGFHLPVGDVARLRAVHPDVYEYLPKGILRPGQVHTTLGEVLATRAPPPRVPGMVVEPHFYFPAWSCGVPEPRTQLLMHRPDCTPRIAWTGAEKIGAAICAFAGLMLAAFAVRRRKQLAA